MPSCQQSQLAEFRWWLDGRTGPPPWPRAQHLLWAQISLNFRLYIYTTLLLWSTDLFSIFVVWLENDIHRAMYRDQWKIYPAHVLSTHVSTPPCPSTASDIMDLDLDITAGYTATMTADQAPHVRQSAQLGWIDFNCLWGGFCRCLDCPENVVLLDVAAVRPSDYYCKSSGIISVLLGSGVFGCNRHGFGDTGIMRNNRVLLI